MASLPIEGNYTVRPSKLGYFFTPRSRSFDRLTRDETADFVAGTCSYTVSPTTLNVAAAGGIESINLTVNEPFCAWTAASNVSWITVASGDGGFGNGTIRINVSPASSPRSGTLTIGGQAVTVNQSGCSFALTPLQQSFPAAGGGGTVTVNANPGYCQWTATSNVPWITINGGTNGSGNGIVTYTVSPTTRPRSGRLTVAGQAFPIYQEFDRCSSLGFGSPAEAATGVEPNEIITADFNNDGKMDLATADYTDISGTPETYTVLLGNGNGTFNSTSRNVRVALPRTLAAADFNGDGKLDIAIAGHYGIAIVAGDGNGGFAEPNRFDPNVHTILQIYAEDLNRDGKVDLIAAGSGTLFVLNGNGNGTFTQNPSLSFTGWQTRAFARTDLNGDGLTDIVIGVEELGNVGRLHYFLGTANGSFSQGITVELGNVIPYEVEAADLNGDGKGDVVTSGSGGAQVQVMLWDSVANNLKSPVRYYTEAFTASRFGIADMDNDGKLDIVTGSAAEYTTKINLLRGNGNGSFNQAIGFDSVGLISSLTFADFNNDGRNDVAMARSSGKVAVQLAACGGSAPRSNAKPFDFDGDGRSDISVFRPLNAAWYINRTTSGFTGLNFGLSTDKLAPADYDGDGKTDVAVFRDGYWYLIQSSNNQFRAVQFGQAGDIPVPADYDGDGRADIAVFRQGNWYFLNTSNNQFRAVQFGIASDKPVAADYDGDGKTDVAVFRQGVWYWLQSSNNQFRALQFGTTNDRPIPATSVP